MADDNFAKLQRLRDIYDPDRRFFDFYAPRVPQSTASNPADRRVSSVWRRRTRIRSAGYKRFRRVASLG
jgi:hypothetical protein